MGMEESTYARLKEHLYSKKPVLGKDSPFSDLLQGMVNRMLDGEMDAHLDEQRSSGHRNKRNGRGRKQVMSDSGPLEITPPRDRSGTFEPELIGKRERTLSSGLDTQILALYAQGNSVEDVRRLLMQLYGVSLSAGKISQITDQVLPLIQEWRTRRLQPFYPIVYLDAVHFKVREDGVYANRAFYTVYSVDWNGGRDLLGMYMEPSEGAMRWGRVLEDLKRRGVEDVLVVCTDDLTGLSEVITDVFPKAFVQKCIVHQVRNSVKYLDHQDSKAVRKALRAVYTAATEEMARRAFEQFERDWGAKYGYIVDQWRSNWDELMVFMSFEGEIRRMIYTTNPVEALHRIIRKLIKGKAAWVSETALLKQIWLSLTHNERSWKRKAYGWKKIQRVILDTYPDRVNPFL